MKHVLVCVFTIAAASAIAFAGACSSSTDSGSSGSSGSSGTSGGGTSGASGVVATSGSSGTSGAADKDTCKPAGASCQCSCTITGQTEDKTKHCAQPAQDTGLCPLVCCTGDINTSSSSGSSGTVVDAGDGG